jgi:hypothetical protein
MCICNQPLGISWTFSEINHELELTAIKSGNSDRSRIVLDLDTSIDNTAVILILGQSNHGAVLGLEVAIRNAVPGLLADAAPLAVTRHYRQ